MRRKILSRYYRQIGDVVTIGSSLYLIIDRKTMRLPFYTPDPQEKGAMIPEPLYKYTLDKLK